MTAPTQSFMGYLVLFPSGRRVYYFHDPTSWRSEYYAGMGVIVVKLFGEE